MVLSDRVAWGVAGAFVMVATLLSLAQMRLHILWNNQANQRKYVLRILFMVPVYGLESWLGLRFSGSAMYFDVLRECYEALVIYSFFQFLVEFLGGEVAVVRMLSDKEASQPHFTPFCCLSTWEKGSAFYNNAKIGTLQYVVIKPVMAVLTFILAVAGRYEDGHFSSGNGYPYVAFVNNASQIWAMYCLILFFMATREELAPVRPVPKFLVVKSVVFFTFWQSVALAVLVRVGLIRGNEEHSTENVVTSVQDFIVCVEMCVAAVAHHYAFKYSDFHDTEVGRTVPPLMRSFFDVVNVTDVYVHDVKRVVQSRQRNKEPAETRETLIAARMLERPMLPKDRASAHLVVVADRRLVHGVGDAAAASSGLELSLSEDASERSPPLGPAAAPVAAAAASPSAPAAGPVAGEARSALAKLPAVLSSAMAAVTGGGGREGFRRVEVEGDDSAPRVYTPPRVPDLARAGSSDPLRAASQPLPRGRGASRDGLAAEALEKGAGAARRDSISSPQSPAAGPAPQPLPQDEGDDNEAEADRSDLRLVPDAQPSEES